LLSKRNAEKKLVVAGHELSLAQQYGLVSIFSFPIFYLAGAGAAVFWVIGMIREKYILHCFNMIVLFFLQVLPCFLLFFMPLFTMEIPCKMLLNNQFSNKFKSLIASLSHYRKFTETNHTFNIQDENTLMYESD